MSTNVTAQAVEARPGRRPVPWLTAILLGGLMAFGTGFWMESLEGAIGSITRSQHPFTSWLRDSSIMLPFFVAAVLGVLALARRKFGPELRRAKVVVPTAVAIAVAGTLVSAAALIANSVHDYHQQASTLNLAHTTHSTALSGETTHDHTSTGFSSGSCSGVCLAKHQTLQAHVRGVKLGSALALLTNVALVGWGVALRGGQLEAGSRRRRTATTPEVTPEPQPAAV